MIAWLDVLVLAAQIVAKQYKGEAAIDSLSLLMPAWLSYLLLLILTVYRVYIVLIA